MFQKVTVVQMSWDFVTVRNKVGALRNFNKESKIYTNYILFKKELFS